MFKAQSDAQIDTLTSEQASSLVAHLNLGPIYNILQGRDQGPLSSILGMDPLSIKEFTVSNKYLTIFHQFQKQTLLWLSKLIRLQ